jgi:beta-xylosidase
VAPAEICNRPGKLIEDFVMRILILLVTLNLVAAPMLDAQSRASSADVWSPDNRDGTYTNPILYADYSDPDVIRVGDDFYMTSSSFSHFPGLPILHSKDLVNWSIIGHAVLQYPYKEFNQPQHGMAIWAPSLRYHNSEFFIYYGDPDRGVFMTKATNPAGPWEPLRLVRKVTGWIDTCPLWDDDGSAYLVHAWANSRSGIKSILAVNRMNKEGTAILDDSVIVFDGHANQPTIEGPKFYKRNGFYYIFAPAGGVKPGWQTVLRSKNVLGPYEDRKVLEQGRTRVNGPHQGAWVETQTGEDWFVHFQDRYTYGRIIHLQPMRWENDWPAIGEDLDRNGIGEPVLKHKKPDVGRSFPIEVPQTSDEFDSRTLGLQWQWEANPGKEWYSLSARPGWLRLMAQTVPDRSRNLWDVPNLMLQKLPAPRFQATVKLDASHLSSHSTSGLLMFGMDYSSIAVARGEKGFVISQILCTNASKGEKEGVVESAPYDSPEVFLRAEIRPEDDTTVIPVVLCAFSYSKDGKQFHPLGKVFTVREGMWVGAKIGLYSVVPGSTDASGSLDCDWFRIEPLR